MYANVPIGDLDEALFGLGAGSDPLSAGASVGLGALAMAVGRARGASGLPITFEEAARSIMDAADGPGSAAIAGLGAAVDRASGIFTEAIRQAATDIGSNLGEVSRGFEVLRAAYTREGNELASRIASALGGGTEVTAAAYSIVYVGTLLYQQGVFDNLLSTIKTAVLDNETLSSIGSSLGLTGEASPAAGAFIGAAVSTLKSAWAAWEAGTHVTIGKEPPASYWGQIATALYAWDGSGCGPSWGRVKDRNTPVTFDPILREWLVVTDYGGKPKRLIDVYGRAKLRTDPYKKWVSRAGGAGCSAVGATITDGETRYNPLGDGGIYNPSAWAPNDVTRMRGVKAPFYCAHAMKVSQFCDGSGRDSNNCRGAIAYGPGQGSADLSYTLRGGLVAAAYLGANVAGIQNLGTWDPPNCGVGSGTWIPGRYWDLGIGGTNTKDADGKIRTNWFACVLTTGQVLVRPPSHQLRQLTPSSSTADRKMAMATDLWYPMFKWTADDKKEFDTVVRSSGWTPPYENVSTSEIPLTIPNGIAQQSPKPVLKLKAFHPQTVAVHYKSGDKAQGLGQGTKIGLAVAGGLVIVGGGYALWRRSRRGR